MIYLDYAANTPVNEEVLDYFVWATRKYIANPNSTHPLGLEAKEKIDEASKRILSYFKSNGEIIYTSGSTESNNLVIKGIALARKSQGNKIIISEVEHSSIIAPCNFLSDFGFDIEIIPLKKDGKIDIDVLKEKLDDKTILVSFSAVDSELGTIQEIDKLAKFVKENSNAAFHTDATQAVGKIKMNFENVDFITFAPHKFYGLNGSGALINMNNIKLIPLIHGGKSTSIFRSGTPVTANILALEKALDLATKEVDKNYKYIKKLNNHLRKEFKKIECVHINSPEDALVSTLNISLINKDTKNIISKLGEHEIFLSTTTACSLDSLPSKSVFAITGDNDLSKNSIRISLSKFTTTKDLDNFLIIFKKSIDED